MCDQCKVDPPDGPIDDRLAGSLTRMAYRPEDSNAPENRAIGAMVAVLRGSVPDTVLYRAVMAAYACVVDRTPPVTVDA